ncbi:retrovirus-related pol polyprotein from transposon TNT 1-94 [Tanacetum coccineum]
MHQRLSHLNLDTINDLAKNDLVTGLLKFKYHKEHLCPSCEQGKSKKLSHLPKPVPNSKQRLHLLHMDLCCPMRVKSINGKRYILVIVDDYSRYIWVHFLRSKDEAPEVIKTFLKKIQVLLQAPIIIVRIDNGLSIIPKMTVRILGKLGAKGDIVFFICYFANSCAYRFKTRTLKHDFWTNQFKTRSYLSPSTITSQKPTERELDLLFEAMYDDYIGDQPSAAPRTAPATSAPQVLQTLTVSTTTANTAPTPTNSSSQAATIPNTS